MNAAGVTVRQCDCPPLPTEASAWRAQGLTVLRHATWPSDVRGEALTQLPGFVASTFGPLVAAMAEACLADADEELGVTAVILASVHGDVTAAEAVRAAVRDGGRVAPLLFYQSVPNSVAGYVAARWSLTGPVVCLSPIADPVAESCAAFRELRDDAATALIVLVEQGVVHNRHDSAVAVLAARDAQTLECAP